MSDPLIRALITAAINHPTSISVLVSGQWITGKVTYARAFVEAYPDLNLEIPDLADHSEDTNLFLADIVSSGVPHPGIMRLPLRAIDAVIVHSGHQSPHNQVVLEEIIAAGANGIEQTTLENHLSPNPVAKGDFQFIIDDLFDRGDITIEQSNDGYGSVIHTLKATSG